MEYTFDIGWMIGGIVITVVGAIMLRFYRPIADNFFLKYSTIQIVAIIFCVVGIMSAFNLLPFILNNIIGAIVPRMGY